mmetsp:Transcript_27912/g.88925  ORF Transcript_27912/g.88925 Transcript_27912/m.88925 type:complete len:244 (-) Transcript_27912:657-1388(-)
MADLFYDEKPSKIYWDRKHFDSFEDQVQKLRGSPLVYVGNLGFYTSESQIRAYFALCGPVKQIIMGLNRLSRRPCGFCFVEYFEGRAALNSVRLLNGTELDGQTIKVELDPGFIPGRQFGRGSAGGQVQDDPRREQQFVADYQRGDPLEAARRAAKDIDKQLPRGGEQPRRRLNSSADDKERKPKEEAPEKEEAKDAAAGGGGGEDDAKGEKKKAARARLGGRRRRGGARAPQAPLRAGLGRV